MQQYTAIPDTAKVSDSLVPLLNNDLTIQSRNFGTSFPAANLVVGMVYYSQTSRILYRLDSVSPVTWSIELDFTRGQIAYADDITRVTNLANTMLPKAGGAMTGYLSLVNDPTDGLHAATKRYVDSSSANVLAQTNTRLSRYGDTMIGRLYAAADPASPTEFVNKNYADYLFNTLNGAKLGKNSDTGNTIFNNGWYYTYGAQGWYNLTYGGGIGMNDGTYVRVWGGKGFTTDWHTLIPGGQIQTNAYGALENRFAGAGANAALTSVGNITSGSGQYSNYRLQQAGAQVQLVGTKFSVNCNCDCNCSCFPAGTLILCEGNIWRPVEQIKVGDKVVTADGVQEVYEIATPKLAGRKMAHFSDGSLFWSEEHLLWSRRAGEKDFWVSASRSVWYNEMIAGAVVGLNEAERVRSYIPGDQFATVEGWAEKTIWKVEMDPETQLYLPHTRGSHTLFANGYLVTAGTDDTDFDYDSIQWEGLK